MSVHVRVEDLREEPDFWRPEGIEHRDLKIQVQDRDRDIEHGDLEIEVEDRDRDRASRAKDKLEWGELELYNQYRPEQHIFLHIFLSYLC